MADHAGLATATSAMAEAAPEASTQESGSFLEAHATPRSAQLFFTRRTSEHFGNTICSVEQASQASHMPPNRNDPEAGLPERPPLPFSRRMFNDANAFYQRYKLEFQSVAGFIAITGLILEIRQSAMV
ncbi:hypothetical protein BP6252_11453 [Coleophoma cylindrospora]|uniref:Uncharacterized protein n=1 Tax=Coleophoma cylindrospora TaxID=1849047 RepID=A0A3D8QK24_9HELO|nr:hypothetical protein BP6252_11453 [Coleophoma cylindrospora]